MQNYNKVADLDDQDMESSGVEYGFSVYEFDIPQELSGRLLGKKMKHVKTIKDLHNAFVSIKRHPFDMKLRTVRVKGSRASVFETLEFLRMKVPPSKFPTVDFTQTNKRHSHAPASTVHTQRENEVADPDEIDMESSGVVPGQFVYEFDFPKNLCGRLIGRNRENLRQITERTNAFVSMKAHPSDPKLKSVLVKGSQAHVLNAIECLRVKFPSSKFPVTFIQTNKRT